MFKPKKCKHKWIPVFVGGTINNLSIKFIGCFCEKCRLGYDESLHIISQIDNLAYASYDEKYFSE